MFQRIITLSILLLSVCALKIKAQQNFKKLKSGVEYTFIIDKPTSPNPEIGDLIRLHFISTLNNRIMYNSLVVNKGKPAEFGVQKPAYKGDLMEAVLLMTPGDSMIVRSNAIDVFTGVKQKLPQGVNPTDKVDYYIKLISIKTKAEAQKEMQAKMNKQMQEQMKKNEIAQKKLAAAQIAKDESALKAYFKKNNVTPTKTASGLYYTITQQGNGEKPQAGNEVKMNYTGTLLDGTKFDSNTDTAFKHTTPLAFKLGKREVIAGWDEGIALLSKGAKATFYIPSTLAYGAQSRPGGGANPKGIPANSCLVFDVELLEFKELPNEDAILQDYFKKNNINATKTPSGLYYSIKNEGIGDKAKPGNTVTMNYTGMFLDGSKFDSNQDSLFQHVTPYTFQLGKGQVIRGWDEGVALLSKGSKGTFYIPSALAYGSSSMPGSAANPKGIPPYSTLMFDVELVDSVVPLPTQTNTPQAPVQQPINRK
jgi:FKBP-type peptidyl-prolyl cis-trans isomerase